MNTLIFNGSPRRQGDTSALIRALTEGLDGAYEVIRAFDFGAGPCVDCRSCVTRDGCAISDGMTRVYDQIRDADRIVIASPIYFSELTGPLLSLASRLQACYCARRFRGHELCGAPKKGGVMLVGGGDGSMARAYDMARCLLRAMNVRDVFPLVSSHHTDELPAARDGAALAHAHALARWLMEDD